MNEWISVINRMPENADKLGAFCPKYIIYTDYGVTEGWYNPDQKGWYALFWFRDERFEKWNIDFVKGDVPKIIFVPDGCESVRVYKWKPFPETD